MLTGIPLIGGMFDNSDVKSIRAVTGIRDIYDSIMQPILEDVDFNPEMASYQTIQEDPMLLMQQMQALEKMQTLADEGLSSQDELAMAMANNEAGQRARQASQAAMQDASARGVSGSGMEFAMREMGNQAAAERARMQGMQQAMQSAQNRALNQHAYSQGLGNLRNQDTGVKQANAGIINQFNNLNTNRRNDAKLRNIDQRRLNEQQRFNNSMGVADGQAGAQRDIAQAYAAQNAARTSERNANTEMVSNMMGGAMMASDKNLKHKIRKADDVLNETFDNLDSYLWEYKNPAWGEGEYVGVMAQDLEKTPMGKILVHDTPEGKLVDLQKMVPMLMAGMVAQQKRIKALEAQLG